MMLVQENYFCEGTSYLGSLVDLVLQDFFPQKISTNKKTVCTKVTPFCFYFVVEDHKNSPENCK